MTSRQELPTALPYVTLRNWHETRLHHPANSESQADLALVRYEEPCLVYVNFQAFVRTVLERIDARGRVHSQAGLTGREEVSSPIPLGNLSGIDEDVRCAERRALAKELYETANAIIRIRGLQQLPANRKAYEYLAASYEGYVAGLLAPFRDQSEFLASVAAIAAQAQAEGRLTIPDFEGQAETVRSSPL